MLNILQCTGQPPQQRVTWPQALTVPRLRSPKIGLKWTLERRDGGRQSRECGACVPSSNASQGRRRNKGAPYTIRENVCTEETDVLFLQLQHKKESPQIFQGVCGGGGGREDRDI